MGKNKKSCCFVPQGGLNIKENKNKQIGLMVAYTAAVEGGNKKLADKLLRQAEKMGFPIKPYQSFANQ